MTNSDTSPASLEPLESRWNDHRAFKWTVERPFQVAQGPKFEIAPCNVYLPRDLENLSLWTQQLSSAWARSRDDFNNLRSNHLRELVPQAPDPPTKVDVTWAAVCDFLETFLQKEAAIAHENGKAMRFFGKAQRPKGTPARVREVPRVKHQPYLSNTTAQTRVWYKLWGRLLEAERPAHQSNEQQTQRLWAKIRRCPRYYPGMKSDDAEAKVKSLTHEANMDRLRPSSS